MLIKKIEVRPSAGENVDGPIGADLQAYCDAMNAAQPRHGYVSGVTKLDLATLSLAITGKAAQVTPGPGVTGVQWAQAQQHEVDPSNPKIWNKIDALALLFDVTMSDGATQHFSVSFEA